LSWTPKIEAQVVLATLSQWTGRHSMRLCVWRLFSVVRLVLSKAVEALPIKLWIGDLGRTPSGCAPGGTPRFEQPFVLFALRHVALRRPGW